MSASLVRHSLRFAMESVMVLEVGLRSNLLPKAVDTAVSKDTAVLIPPSVGLDTKGICEVDMLI